MSNYNVEVINSCLKFLNDLEKYNISIHNQLCDTIRDICFNPFQSKFKRLENSEKDRRARSGDFRIIYFVNEYSIFITKIDLRKDVYKMGVGCPKFNKKKIKSL